MELTQDQLLEVFPNAREDLVEAICNGLNVLAEDYEINSPLRLAHFLAQTAHESGGFRLTEENLNYSAQRLLEVFPKYFRNVDANAYARKPEKIASRVYANRMGNGDEASGDGWKYRGRGLIQLTGKSNYTRFANFLDFSLDDVDEFMKTPEGALESAAWFWYENDLNQLADADNITAVTKKINGGTNGLEERRKYTSKFKKILGV